MASSPCSDYRIDATALQFGQCVCGHPKQAHISKGENKAAAALRALKKVSGTGMSDGQQSMPCSTYTLDPLGSVFGQCRCGHLKDAHIAKERNPAEAARSRLNPNKREAVTKSEEPCSNFIVDTTSDQFGVCICGHKRDAHNAQEVNRAEAALLAMKEKNAKKEAAKKASEDAARLEVELKIKAEEGR